jgi:nucleotide-binding universal stress UspA family protein
MKTILLATDGSDDASEALEFAERLCRELGAQLEVLTVKPAPILGRAGASPPILEVEEPGGAEHIAAAAADEAVAVGVPARSHVAHGDPAEMIVTAGDALGAELIVVGSRGLGAVAGSLLGSVSHELIKRSHIPVTIVPHHVHDRTHA